jgi:hypothetical protein
VLVNTTLAGIAPKTRSNQEGLVHAWEGWCLDHFLNPWPVSDCVHVCAFLDFLAPFNQVPSLKKALAAIKKEHELRGFRWALLKNPLIEEHLKGAHRQFPQTAEQAAHAAAKRCVLLRVTALIASTLPSLLVRSAHGHEARLWHAASTLATVLCLRGSEFCYRPTFVWTDQLRVQDVSFDVDAQGWLGITITLFNTKTAPVVVLSTRDSTLWDSLCAPASSILNYMLGSSVSMADPNLLLFRHSDGSPLLLANFITSSASLLRSVGLHADGLKSGSWRAGGAQGLKLQGATEDVIKRVGRWKSNAWLSYVVESVNEAAFFQARVAAAASHLP